MSTITQLLTSAIILIVIMNVFDMSNYPKLELQITRTFPRHKTKIHHISDQPTVPESPDDVFKILEINESFNPLRKQLGYFYKNDLSIMRVFSGHHDAGSGNDILIIPKSTNQKIIEWANCVQCKFTIYLDCYVSFIGAVSNGTHIIDAKNYTALEWMYGARQGPVTHSYHRVIVFGHALQVYGHFGLDFLAPLMLVPNEFLKSATILCCDYREFKVEFFRLLGLDKQVVFGSANQWVNADYILVATHPKPHVAHFGPTLKKLSSKLRKAAKVDKIVPNRYVMMNRKGKRAINNFKECVKAVKSRFSEYNWEVVTDELDVLANAKLYSTIKFIFTVVGSNCFNFMFMKEGGIAVLYCSILYDYSVYLDAQCLDIRTVVFVDKDFSHDLGGSVPVSRAEDAIDIGLHYLKYQKWPDPNKNIENPGVIL